MEIGTYQLLEHSNTAREAIMKTDSPNLDIIPAHIDLVAIEIELVDKESREYMLKKSLNEIKDDYDYILIDCAPSLGLLTLNALTAADSVIIPIQCEYFALEGLGKLLNTIKSVQKIHNPELDIEAYCLPCTIPVYAYLTKWWKRYKNILTIWFLKPLYNVMFV